MIQYDLIADIALIAIPNPTAKVVLLALAKFSNAEGKCFPSQDTLAECACVSNKTVRSSLQWLIEHGYVRAESREGTSNLYIITSMEEEDMTDQTGGSVNITDEDDRYNIVDISQVNRTKYISPSSVNITDPFEVLWSVYPRRIGKGAARTAFAKAKRHTNPLEIIDAAHRYASFCQEQGKEKRFIPHLSTWLNQERWEDDLESEIEEPTQGAWGNAVNDF